MKTRAEDLEDAVKEALQMLAMGRPADAQETLSAALEAPTGNDEMDALRRDNATLEEQRDRNLREAQHYREMYEQTQAGAVAAAERLRSERDAARDGALEEAAQRCKAVADTYIVLTRPNIAAGECAVAIRALKFVPAERHIPEAEVRRVVREVATEGSGSGPSSLMFSMANEILRRLGVDLDAAPACNECGLVGAHKLQCGRRS